MLLPFPEPPLTGKSKTTHLRLMAALSPRSHCLTSAHGLGALAEVVSEMEFEFAKRLGVPNDRIIVNGPLHDARFVERCLTEGVCFNADSVRLLGVAADIAKLQRDLTLMFPDCRLALAQSGDIMILKGQLAKAEQARQQAGVVGMQYSAGAVSKQEALSSELEEISADSIRLESLVGTQTSLGELEYALQTPLDATTLPANISSEEK